MGATLLAATAGVIGIVLGRLWDGRSEAARWRRDQETASYQRLAEASISLYEEIRTIALTERGTGALNEAIDRARRDKTWDNALVAVWLHGSASVVAAASLMDRTVTELFYGAQSRQHSTEEWNRARIPSADTFEQFLASVRKDINLSPVSVRLFPYASD
ncbi:hypothetical protein Q3V23_31650 [Streptomyces sp. VNUA116]|uniref:hypothetical protein n=1 Tax=Streptomyces sp. VNUA116 TaxID=3062449 RepID=UPI0026768936|nr:hypothetical protein [Streptomyces sp. VNUA116]WKU48254.1 hypothetical protein Q3V23_31650 [Streptomyces sp. VNUA116]